MAQGRSACHKKKAAEVGAKVVFEDEVCFQQEGTSRQSWARRGIGFIVKHHPCKRRSKFFGAISLEAAPGFVFQKANWFNSRTYEKFLAEILNRFGKVVLIVDNVMYHRAKRLKAFLETNKDRLWLFNLPPYSPELNPVELVWRETKKNASHNRYFPTKKGLTRAVMSRFKMYQDLPSMLSGIVAQYL